MQFAFGEQSSTAFKLLCVMIDTAQLVISTKVFQSSRVLPDDLTRLKRLKSNYVSPSSSESIEKTANSPIDIMLVETAVRVSQLQTSILLSTSHFAIGIEHVCSENA
jgi:hypothetical protein